MTPDLMEQGAKRVEQYQAALAAKGGNTESGGRAAGFSRLAIPGEVDITHGRILYLEDVSVSFDGFKACLLYTSPSPRDRTRSRMPSSA